MGRRCAGKTRFHTWETMKLVAHTLDTSFVIRLLTRDPVAHFKSASAFVTQWKEGRPKLIVPDLVLAEAYYALQHHYGFPKTEALAALLALSRHPAMAFTPHASNTLALPELGSAKPGFVDHLIHGASQAAGTTLVTFEKSARKLPDTLVLAPSGT